LSEIGICIIKNLVTATAALDKQIERYRSMTGEQRLTIALDLHELSCDIAREGIRHGHPEADPAEVERLLRLRLELTHAG
jgi:Rv0078B-related antitoxin